ncbi:MAG: cytidylate kinase-like family protein [Clostridia bacterium]|nr:cytidylate kinase-like family protein [Clostridia bacterium]
MSYNIITISRQFGSGGRTIGKALAEKLGVPCYDSEIIEKVAEKSGFDRDYVKEKGEDARGAKLSGLFKSNYYYKSSDEDIIWEIQSRIVSELAEQGPCVMIGRCADYILREREDVFNVFICADMKSRAQRIVTVYGEKEDSPEKRLKDKDKRRASYYQLFTDLKWGVASNYDISLNAGSLGIDRCVDILYDICTQ